MSPLQELEDSPPLLLFDHLLLKRIANDQVEAVDHISPVLGSLEQPSLFSIESP